MEGPSLVILNEELLNFLDKEVISAKGNTKQPKEMLKGRILDKIDTWGKVLFLTFSDPNNQLPSIVTKTHFLLFGSYRIGEPRDNRSPRLELKFLNGTIYFYSCSFQFQAEEFKSRVDEKVDLMSFNWDDEHVLHLLLDKKNTFLCDLFLDQTVFAGSGNIVKNEVLFNIRRHPLTKLSQVRREDWNELAHAVRDYCFNFYEWKKKYELRKHWQVYRKSVCPICGEKIKKEKLGKYSRMTFYCPKCQKLEKGISRLEIYPVIPIGDSNEKQEEILDH